MLTKKLNNVLYDVNLTPINTEYEFYQHMRNLSEPYLNLVMLDIMLRWTDPSPNMVQPHINVKKEGYYRAGFRCEYLIRQNRITKDIPVLLYTLLDEQDIEEDMLRVDKEKTKYVGKNADDELLSWIKKLSSSVRK